MFVTPHNNCHPNPLSPVAPGSESDAHDMEWFIIAAESGHCMTSIIPNQFTLFSYRWELKVMMQSKRSMHSEVAH